MNADPLIPSEAHRHLVIIDDNPADVELIQIAIELRGMVIRVESAGGGEAGIELLSRLEREGRLPHVVLLDLNMPRVSGFDVLGFARNRPAFATTGMVVLTSSIATGDRERSLLLGADEFLVKPADLDGLIAMLDPILKYFPT